MKSQKLSQFYEDFLLGLLGRLHSKISCIAIVFRKLLFQLITVVNGYVCLGTVVKGYVCLGTADLNNEPMDHPILPVPATPIPFLHPVSHKTKNSKLR